MSQPFIVVIPARYASTRLPGKPLLDIAGKPMLQHVWEQAKKSAAQDVVIATDDERIAAACEQFNAKVVLTRADHESGTDRLAEVAEQLNLPEEAILVNVQGDEPLIPASIIDQVAMNLATHSAAKIATLAEPITQYEQLFNPNVVKVSTNKHGMALTFSRAPLPWARDALAAAPKELPNNVHFRRHIGIYAYRAGFLADFVRWGACELEQVESLEQLRALWNGVQIHVADALAAPPAGVDTEQDLARVRALLAK